MTIEVHVTYEVQSTGELGMRGTDKLISDLAEAHDTESHSSGCMMVPPYHRDQQFPISTEVDASTFRKAVQTLFADKNIKGECF